MKSLLALVSITLLLASCGTKTEETNETGDTPTTPVVEETETSESLETPTEETTETSDVMTEDTVTVDATGTVVDDGKSEEEVVQEFEDELDSLFNLLEDDEV
ncbi:MAG: hypothetical protein H6767_04725 [Candidatus Peribacteria bacterium]|nr:MAG: hypothetical protein H6767_04725 [Candidatus Peribacteria bacterium]